MDAIDAYAEVVSSTMAQMQISVEDGADSWQSQFESQNRGRKDDPRDLITDIREFDVPYYLRVAIDNGMKLFMG